MLALMTMDKGFFVFCSLGGSPIVTALVQLERALLERDKAAAMAAYYALYAALAEGAHVDLMAAVLDGLLQHESSFSRQARRAVAIPAGLRQGAAADLERLVAWLKRDWRCEVEALVGARLPGLSELAEAEEGQGVELAGALRRAQAGEIELDALIECLWAHYRRCGVGELARYRAFRWVGGRLVGVPHPAGADLARLVDLSRPLEKLVRNTEAFLAGKPAQHALLYGPRGSGKSTSVRGLLHRYAERGLRLVELPVAALTALPEVVEAVREAPQHFILFVDDLSFEADDARYAPLKTLLEGSLVARSDNVLLYATSNRRHLLRERFSDRPDPLDDDVHAWDTQHERLALADRFGLLVTFPDATQQRYLRIVRALAECEGFEPGDLETRAIRFAEWGNGYSGRTAQQFIESVKAKLV
jgi:predicted AAA+ superfamily ATPase